LRHPRALIHVAPSKIAVIEDVRRLSEPEAYHRILAARTARKHPRILAMLREGRLNCRAHNVYEADLVLRRRAAGRWW
jgi:hypothetical protein